VAAAAWTLAILTAPALAAGHTPTRLRASAFVYVVGGVVCHQRADRSFHLAGGQLPVCARCTGLYLSGAGGLLMGLLWLRRPGRVGADESRGDVAAFARWRRLLILSVLPMAASLVVEWAGLGEVSNAWRAVTSLPAGWAVGLLLAESSSFRGKLQRCVRMR
jgi:uncharacterized membrane protein